MKIFLSVGRTATDAQRLFLEKLEQHLDDRGLQTKTVGRNTFTAGQPLELVKETMRNCRGLLVFAFERTTAGAGYELQADGQSPLQFSERKYATPWHHIELAMGNMLGMPTLVILERGVHAEGLLEDKYGWYVIRTPLDPSAISRAEFQGVLDAWIASAKAGAREQALDVGELTIGQIVRNMRPSQAWTTLGSLSVVLAGAFALGQVVPKLLGAADRGGMTVAAAKAPAAEPAPETPAAPASSPSVAPTFSHCAEVSGGKVTFFRERSKLQQWLKDRATPNVVEETFDKYKNEESVSDLFLSRIQLSGTKVMHGNWGGEKRVPGAFRGGALIAQGSKAGAAGRSIALTTHPPIVALGANLYDDGDYKERELGAGSNVIRMFVTTDNGDTAFATDCATHLGDTGFIGAASEDGITRISLAIDEGAFELDGLIAAWR